MEWVDASTFIFFGFIINEFCNQCRGSDVSDIDFFEKTIKNSKYALRIVDSPSPDFS